MKGTPSTPQKSPIVASVITALTVTLLPVSPAHAADQHQPVQTPPAVANTNSDKSAEITRELSESFETVFTEVVSEQPTGQWEPNYENAAKHGLSAQEADALAEFMETPLPQESHPEQPDIATRDLGSFAECVVWNIAPVPMSPQDAQAIGRLLKDKQWSQAAEKITQVAALNGATAALDYGISAIGGPVAWAAKLALYAGSCALSEQM